MQFFPVSGRSVAYQPDESLTQLANRFETDKGDADKSTLSWGRDYPEHLCMNYTGTYEKYMGASRSDPVKLFEVGIRDKRFPFASCKMWLSYFKNIELYAMDNLWGDHLSEKLGEVAYLTSLGANFVYADQGNFNDWNEIAAMCPNDFDFFVEDGSHWPNHMAVTLWKSIPLMRHGGFYFMEDLQNPLTARGKFKYDNALLTEELLTAEHSGGVFTSGFLNDNQNDDIKSAYELVDLVLDKHRWTYMAVFRKR